MILSLSHIGLFAAGAATAAVVRVAGRSETVGGKAHNVAVRLVAAGMRAADAVGAATQTVADEAADVNADARRQARIDAAVRERLEAAEREIRAQVTAEVDAAEDGE